MIRSTFLILALLVSFATHSSGAPLYTITDLGTLGGSKSSADSINNNGQVAGSSYITGDKAQHAFIYKDGKMIDLGTLGGTNSFATDINDSGMVVGYSDIAGNAAAHAFRWTQDGGMVDLGTLGGTNSIASCVNNRGTVAGHSNTAGDKAQHAYLLQGGNMTDLGTLGGTNSFATGINSKDKVVGYSEVIVTGSKRPARRAFLWSNGNMTDIGTLGGFHSHAGSINDRDQITGDSNTSVLRERHAFLYSNGKMSDIDTLSHGPQQGSWASDINNSGQVTGKYKTPGAGLQAFIYSGGQMSDLKTLLDPSSGWSLANAAEINDKGQIAGDGSFNNGPEHAFLMTPLELPVSRCPPGNKCCNRIKVQGKRLCSRCVPLDSACK